MGTEVLNESVLLFLQLSITAMVAWLVYTVHHLEISSRLQDQRIIDMKDQIETLRKQMHEIYREN